MNQKELWRHFISFTILDLLGFSTLEWVIHDSAQLEREKILGHFRQVSLDLMTVNYDYLSHSSV